ncbi:MAG: SpoIIE family protein phosphatase [Terriglobales bacterium]
MAPPLNPDLAVRRCDWGLAERPLAGQSRSGDAALVIEFAHGCLLAVADGLGHGAEAAAAAGLAMDTLRRNPAASVLQSLSNCHEALRSTRGAVMSLARVNYGDRSLTWAGFGNVGGMLLRAGQSGEGAREYLLCRSGTLGVQLLPPPYAAITTIAAGDTLVFFTDGLEPAAVAAFTDLVSPPDRAAGALLRSAERGNDDALVLVARFREVEAR